MSVKHSPDIRFLLDDTFDRMDETNRLFAQEDVRRDLAADDDAGED
jgi:ribosome-binding factor A